MKITVIGYTESFALNPNVSIYKDGVLIDEVAKGNRVVLDIPEACELEFKCSFRSAQCYVEEGVGCIVLSFNRATGKLVATPTANEQEALFEITKAKSADGSRIIWAVILFVIGVLLMVLSRGM